MQSCLLTESLQPALESFHSLTALYGELQDSQCRHLLSFMTETILFWNQILRDRVAEYVTVRVCRNWIFCIITLIVILPSLGIIHLSVFSSGIENCYSPEE